MIIASALLAYDRCFAPDASSSSFPAPPATKSESGHVDPTKFW